MDKFDYANSIRISGRHLLQIVCLIIWPNVRVKNGLFKDLFSSWLKLILISFALKNILLCSICIINIRKSIFQTGPNKV